MQLWTATLTIGLGLAFVQPAMARQGACCQPDGTCVVLSEADCDANGGTHLVRRTCAEVACPIGACCFDDQACVVTTRLDCDASGGLFLGHDSSCSTAACAAACCLTDGSCATLSPDACGASGGFYLGFGSDCSDASCGVGSCCVGDGCLSSSRADCATASGIYLREGVDCAGPNCAAEAITIDVSIGPWTEIVDVDLFSDDGGMRLLDRVSVLAQHRMTVGATIESNNPDRDTTVWWSLSGNASIQYLDAYLEYDWAVQDGPLALAPAEAPWGDGPDFHDWGTLAESSSMGWINEVPQENPGGFTGSFAPLVYSVSGLHGVMGSSGYNYDLTGYRGRADIVIAYEYTQLGACFTCDGGCELADVLSCEDAGGTYLGDGVACDPSMVCGSCCYDDGACADELLEADCDAIGGTFTPSMTCADVVCGSNDPTGACCLDDGLCSEKVAQGDCDAISGAFFEAMTCAAAACPEPDPTGACCLTTGTCAGDTTEAECDDLGGTFAAGSSCAAIECVMPDPTGSCCFSDGSCLDGLTAAGCDAFEGTFGEGVECADAGCTPVDPVGACCFDSGACVGDVMEDDCFNAGGGSFAAGVSCNDAACEPAAPPTGACCLCDGSCEFLDADECNARGGVFRVGLECGEANCPEDLGSCCYGDYASTSCVDRVSRVKCQQFGGIFRACTSCGGGCGLPDGTCVFIDQWVCTEHQWRPFGSCTACLFMQGGLGVQGSCCLSTALCVQITRDACVIEGGTYYGDGVDCWEVACDPAAGQQTLTGACCHGTISCSDVTAADCQTIGGSFLGIGSDCEGGYCPSGRTAAPSPAEVMVELLLSWGPCPDVGSCATDLNKDRRVDFEDLLLLCRTESPGD